MPLKIQRFQNISAFDSDLTTLLTTSPAGTRVFVNVFGTETPETNNQSWCPDCVIADPLIRKWVGKCQAEQVILVEAPAGDRTT
jgi:hypothetical protein